MFVRILGRAEMLVDFPEPKLEAYIFLIARGVSIDHLRKAKKELQIDLTDDLLFNLTQKQEDPNPTTSAFNKVDLALMMKKVVEHYSLNY